MRLPGALPQPLTWRAVYRRPRPSLVGAFRLWQRNVTSYKRIWHLNVLPNFFEPVFYLLAIGFGLGRFVESIDGVEYARYIAPGLAAVSTMMGASYEVTFNVYAKLHFHKLYDAVNATPLAPEDIALGEIMWGVTRSVLYGVPFVLIAALYGLVESWWALSAPIAAAVIGFCFAAIGLTFTAFIPSIEMFSFYYTLFLTPLFLFSGVFFTVETLPAWAQPLAWFSPLFHAAELFRELFGVYGTDIVSALGHLVWLLGLGLIFLPAPQNVFRHRLIL